MSLANRFTNKFMYLDTMLWSPLWEEYMDQALDFRPLDIHIIDCIIAVPEKGGALVFSENNVYHSPVSPLTTLNHFALAHSFVDYSVMSACLKSFGCFGQYKPSWVCPFFALCPLEGRSQNIWINPLKVYKVQTIQDDVYVFMMEGPKILIPLTRRSVLIRTEMTCVALATIQRDCFQIVLRGTYPLDYLKLPNTPFCNTLSRRAALLNFTIPYGQLVERFRKTYMLLEYDKLQANDINQ